VAVKILVFDRDQRVTQDLRVVIISSDDPALQGERAYYAPLVVVEVGGGTGAIVLEFLNLREVGGVDEKKADRGANQRGDENQQDKDNGADVLPSGGLYRRKLFVDGLHGGGFSIAA